MFPLRLWALALIGVAVLWAPGARGAGDSAYLWLNFMQCQPRRCDQVTPRLVREGEAALDPLIKAGTVLEWGIAEPVMEDAADRFTHVEWMTLANWDAAEAVAEHLSRRRDSAEWRSIATRLELDVITRSAFAGAGRPDRPRYLFLTFLRAGDASYDAGTEALRSVMGQALDPLLPGKIVMNYGVLVPELRADSGWTHLAWFAVRTLDNRNDVDRAIGALPAGSRGSRWVSASADDPVFEAGSRQQQLLQIRYYRRRTGLTP